MKESIPAIITIMFLSCSEKPNNQSLLVNDSTAYNSVTKMDFNTENNFDKDKFIGTFEYIYPYNSDKINENHYIVITKTDTVFYGFYYGTTDVFDGDSREGYDAGFFVTPMEKIEINGNEIEFTLTVPDKDIFTKSVDLKIKSSNEARKAGYKNWIQEMNYQPKEFYGVLNGDSLTVDEFPGQIIFKKLQN